jgi:hypothetical protein
VVTASTTDLTALHVAALAFVICTHQLMVYQLLVRLFTFL